MWEEERENRVALIVLAVLAVSLILFSAYMTYQYLVLAGEYSKLKAEASSLRSRLREYEQRYSSLASSYHLLAQKYSSLKTSYNSLLEDCREIQERYNKLKVSYSKLDKDFKELLYVNRRLEAKVKAYLQAGGVRIGLEDATALVQPDDPRIVLLAGAITHGYNGPVDLYLDLWRMYRWVTTHIRYADDPSPAVVIDLRHRVIGGYTVLYDFTYTRVGDYWKYAVETLTDGKGDCEDQAILLASMIRAYFRHYVGRDYQCYVLTVSFAGKGGHALVIVPVKGHNIVILDPAGHYYTNIRGVIASRQVYSEFARYQAAWRARIARYNLIFNEKRYTRLSGSLDSLVKALYGG